MRKREFAIKCILAAVIGISFFFTSNPAVLGKKLEIAVMVPNGVDPYFTAKRYGYETECEKLGIDKMYFYDAGGFANLGKQIKQVEDAMQKGLDGIILGVVSKKGSVPVVNKVIDKGIPLILDNLDCDTDRPVIRNMKNGELVGLLRATYIIRALKGKGKVLLMAGPAKVELCQQEHRGFVNYAKHFPGIKIITEWTGSRPDVGMTTVEGALQANPDIKAIATFSPPLTVGPIQAVRAAGYKPGEIIIVAQTLDAGLVDYMKKGWLQATVMTDHIEMARLSVRMLLKVIKGELKPPLFHRMDHYLITKGTIDKYDTRGSSYPKEWRK